MVDSKKVDANQPPTLTPSKPDENSIDSKKHEGAVSKDSSTKRSYISDKSGEKNPNVEIKTPSANIDDRLIRTTIPAQFITTKEKFKNFMLAKQGMYQDIAQESIELNSKKPIPLSLSKVYDPCGIIVIITTELLNRAISGTDSFINKGTNAEIKKFPIYARVLSFISFTFLLPIAIVATILTAPIVAADLSIQKLQNSCKDKEQTKKIVDHIYASVLEKTFSIINIADTEDENVWKELAESIEKTMLGEKTSAFAPIMDNINIGTDDYIAIITTIVENGFKNIIAKLPDDKTETSFRYLFRTQVLDAEGKLTEELKPIINQVVNNLNEHISNLKIE